MEWGQRRPRRRAQEGHCDQPLRACSRLAASSCTAYGWSAGLPVPPTLRHVASENWKAPKYRPPPPTARGLPEDSQRASAAQTASTDLARLPPSVDGGGVGGTSAARE